jgi:hypothetical protein
VPLEYCARLLDVNLYAKTRAGGWFAAKVAARLLGIGCC